mmetsp:Transcript_159401/g.511424  ORF Transcript_159401/g.511424 Transcript_159401/m.511424 type:complete len:208 (+) Transcript_159401:1256-1879(+)
MLTTTVWPCLAKPLSVCMTLIAWKLSKPDVGSSTKIRRGWWSNSQPMLTRFRSPPDTPRWPGMSLPTTVSATGVRPSCANVHSTRESRSEASGKRNRAIIAKVSRTVESANNASSCSTYAIMAGRSREEIGTNASPRAPMPISPRREAPRGRIGVRPANELRSDVLPDPLGPMTAKTWPGTARPLTPSNIFFVLLGLPPPWPEMGTL